MMLLAFAPKSPPADERPGVLANKPPFGTSFFSSGSIKID